MKIRVSVIGASGYTGIELIRLLSGHPNVELIHLISETYSSQKIAQVFPHLAKLLDMSFNSLDTTQIAQESDVVFLAMPHTKAAKIATALLEYGCRVIDLSADLRLNSGTEYQEWYAHPAADPALLDQAVYGLAEIGLRERISQAQIIANPGCYPTATILGLAPLMVKQLVDLNNSPLIIDAKSGISGAGRIPNLDTHFCEMSNNFAAYQIAGIHRHIPEMEQELTKLAKNQVMVQFTPHLIPTTRGMMTTIYCKLKQQISSDAIATLYNEYYQGSYFMRVSIDEQRPGIKSVIGSNFCNISLYVDQRTGYLVIISMIDNLIKGASGQAIQNMNLMYQHPEQTGLERSGIYP